MPITKHFRQRFYAEHIAKCRLRQQFSRRERVVDIGDSACWVEEAKIEHGIDGYL
jgi:hypothetical protein